MTQLDLLLGDTQQLLDDAACADHPSPHWWTGNQSPQPRGRHRPTSDAVRAIRVCAECPVRRRCLDVAMATEHPCTRHGIWGGLTPGDRNRLHDGQLSRDDIDGLVAERAALPTDVEAEPWLDSEGAA